MFEGDLKEGELEIGQSITLVNKIQASAEIIEDILDEYQAIREKMRKAEFGF